MTSYGIITVYATGLKRGYIRIADRTESDKIALPESLKGIRGNARKALELFKRKGCTHYTVEQSQLINSTQYCFTVYRGYKELNHEQSKT